jgi:hypothetical protein
MMLGSRLLCLVLALLVAIGAQAAHVWAAERVAVRVGEHPGFSRIVFDWSGPVGARLEQQVGKAILRFDRLGELDLARFRSDPPPEVARIDAKPDGAVLVVTLTIVRGAQARLFESEGNAVLDVLRSGIPADARASTPEEWRRRQAAKAAEAKPGQATGQSKPALSPVPAGGTTSSKAADGAAPEAAKAAGPAARGETQSTVNAPISLLPPAPSAPEPRPVTKPKAAPDAKATSGPEAATTPKAASTPEAASESRVAPESKAKPQRATVDRSDRRPGAAPSHATAGAATAPTDHASEAGTALIPSGSSPVMIDTSPLPGRAMSRGVPRVLRFDWPQDVAAAAFRRDGKTWLVFDRAPPGDLAGAISQAAPELEPVEQFEMPGATVIRFAAPAMLVARLRRDNTTWVVELEPGAYRGEAGIEALVEGGSKRPDR